MRRLALTLTILPAAAVITAPAAGAVAHHGRAVPAGLAERLRSQMRALVRAGVPGVVVHVRRGRSSLELAAGHADLATGAPMRVADWFKVGSITKPFVATLVLQLVGEHRLNSITDAETVGSARAQAAYDRLAQTAVCG